MARLTADPIDAAALLAAVASPLAGASVLFLGTVRELTGGERTAALHYEAYAAMAEGGMGAIETELRGRWPVCVAALVHRLGTLAVGEVSVAVAVSAPHRTDAFDAARFAIDALKERVPIWKQDIPPAGPPSWTHPGTDS